MVKNIMDGFVVLSELFIRYPILEVNKESIILSTLKIIDAIRSGHKILVCGNGGSAADAEHIVGELMKNFKIKRKITNSFKDAYYEKNNVHVPEWLEGAIPAISLVSQTALNTAFCNDESSEGVFAQQVFGYGIDGDVLICISTSGESKNIIEAARMARAKNIFSVALTGRNKSALSTIADITINVPETETYKIQELHLPIYHAICAELERNLFKND